MATTLTDYLAISKNAGKWLTITSKAADVAAQTKYFKDNISKVTSIDGFLNNSRLFNYAMTAFGLEDRLTAKGLMRKVLQQGVTSPAALANTLQDARIKAFATAFDFAGHGAATTQRTQATSDVVSRFVQHRLETQQGKQNPGVELALYFERIAPNLTSSYGILADKNLLTVVQTALGISPLTANQNIDIQARALDAKIKVADFKDTKKLHAFIARFAAQYDASAAPDAQSGNTGSQGFGFDTQLLLALQNVRRAI